MGRFLVGKGDRVVRTDTYLVRVEGHDGRVFEDLEPRRLFPFTAPDRFVTLMDSKENEQALINDMNALDEASRRAIEECFAEFYLIPEVTGIIHIDDKLIITVLDFGYQACQFGKLMLIYFYHSETVFIVFI